MCVGDAGELERESIPVTARSRSSLLLWDQGSNLKRASGVPLQFHRRHRRIPHPVCHHSASCPAGTARVVVRVYLNTASPRRPFLK